MTLILTEDHLISGLADISSIDEDAFCSVLLIENKLISQQKNYISPSESSDQPKTSGRSTGNGARSALRRIRSKAAQEGWAKRLIKSLPADTSQISVKAWVVWTRTRFSVRRTVVKHADRVDSFSGLTLFFTRWRKSRAWEDIPDVELDRATSLSASAYSDWKATLSNLTAAYAADSEKPDGVDHLTEEMTLMGLSCQIENRSNSCSEATLDHLDTPLYNDDDESRYAYGSRGGIRTTGLNGQERNNLATTIFDRLGFESPGDREEAIYAEDRSGRSHWPP